MPRAHPESHDLKKAPPNAMLVLNHRVCTFESKIKNVFLVSAFLFF
jgi:hypothetical protein